MQLNDSVWDVSSNGGHQPVLAGELVELLDPQPDDTVIDCTFGAGGHARKIAALLDEPAVFIGIDRDPEAQRYFDMFEQEQACRCRFIHSNFADALQDMGDNGFQADLIYLDLGVSSMQLDRPERGFSYSYNAPLDMRMDPETSLTARQVVNGYSYEELVRIFKDYGEERYSRQIARYICREREKRPYETTLQLVDTVKAAIPTPARFGAGHPARRVFQALRIAVNDELASLERGLDMALNLLAPGGCLAVISFHSLEDRIVKRFFNARVGRCECPPDLPQCVCGAEASIKVLTRRPVTPSADEIGENPRSQSAKLRAAEKLG
ncbi:ribosomal RNA small subunit methyltransferase H [bacterium BMS3Abin01]|nr:ribosomal RNA small subunit methyltransferase H [bacterium BMS3Abin01]HDY69604.1 16S rRNA (cytosine(1402)-N(4))-methyltransferase RsmH [Actinomycetota bacterium]